MKLKLRADSKDWTIFAIFTVVLFYIICILLGNLLAFANVGEDLPGLNPFYALINYTAVTILVFLAVMAIITTSVSSHFFEFEKGFGISSDPKKTKGYSRWATDKEMKKKLKKVDPKAEKSDVAGIPLMNNGKEIWVDPGESHNLVIGSTASGKTEAIVQPMVKTLLKAGESMIITDPKGEIYERNGEELREKGYNVVVLNFRNPQMGNCWNPLTLPYNLYKSGNMDKAIELLDDLAKNILYDESSKGQDPFWENTSADYFTGLCLALFEDAKEEEINLNSINLMTTDGEDKIGGTTYMKEYFSDKDRTSPMYINVASTINAPNETKSSILSVFKQKIKLFSSKENLSEMLSKSDFDMKDIGRQKTAVFIIIHDEKKTYHPLATIFVKQCYETLIDVAFESGGKLIYKTNFILDEFANMPPLKDVDAMVTAARSRKIRFTYIIQNFAQLTEVYGKEKGDTIKGNCSNWIYLISSEIAALEEISKMCGEVKSKKDDKTVSTPLVTISDLQRLPMYTMIILRSREMPFKTKMTPAWQMDKNNSWGKKYEKSKYVVREKNQVSKFELKPLVEKRRQEKLDKMLSADTPEIGGFGLSSMTNVGGIPPLFGSDMTKPPIPGSDSIKEIMKKIDEKIAEFEEEERLEKEAIEKSKQEVKEENNLLETKENIVEQEITDDQFFDDFFGDDE